MQERRKRRTPARFDANSSNATQFTSEQVYRVQYFEVIDTTVSAITSRFDQRGMSAQIALEQLVFDASTGHQTYQQMEEVKSYYNTDFDYILLETELRMLANLSKSAIASVEQFVSFVEPRSPLFPQLNHLARLLILMPGSNAVSERSFSAMKRVKTAYRSSMGQLRLNSLMLLHVHTRITDNINIDSVIDAFVDGHERRKFYLY